MRLRVLMLIGVAAVCGGCRSHPATEVLVIFHADATLRAAASRLAVQVDGPEGRVFDAEHPVASSTAGALARVPLVPRGGDATRTFQIRGTLLDDDGNELGHVEAISGYSKDRLLELHLWFDGVCRGVPDCGPGRTCSRGVCVGSCFTASSAADRHVRSEPSCGECEQCSTGACVPVDDGASCGCPVTDRCGGGKCLSSVQVWSATGGLRHSCASVQIADKDQIYCWGTNNAGELGTGGPASPAPALVDLLGAFSVVAGTDSTCARGFGGERYCWGSNGNGQLGLGTVEDTIARTPVRAPGDDPEWIDVDAGWYHYCGLTDDARLLCWGLNDHGQVGLDPDTAGQTIFSPVDVMPGSHFEAVSAGGFTSCGIRDDGTLWCWGYNESGNVGVGDAIDHFAPVQAGCVDGTCYEDWKKVATGDFHTCAIRDGGELWCWGAGTSGQLGIGEVRSSNEDARWPVRALMDRWTSVRAGQSHTCGMRDDSTLWCWGANDQGQLGLGDSSQRAAPAEVPAPGGGRWLQAATGRDHTCAVRDDRTLWCWGRNDQGQTGNGLVTQPGEPLVATPQQVCFAEP